MHDNSAKAKKRNTVYIWILLTVAFFALFLVRSWHDPGEHRFFDTFLQDIEDGRVASIQVHDNEIHVSRNDGSPDYLTLGVVDDELTQRLSQHGAHVRWKKPSRSLVTILSVALPLLLLIAFLWYFAKKAGTANQGMFSLGKSRARLVTESQVTFADVGGCQKAKEQLGDVIDFLNCPSRWETAGARLPRGVLLEGPPGCGKTLLARAVAGETQAKFYSVSASEFVELFVGVGAARVRDMFQEAGKNAPAVIFIDEIDAVGRRRGSGLGMANDEREQTLNQLLVSLDGFEKDQRVVVIAATNRSDILDPALLRSGRFDRRITVPLLSGEARLEVLRIHTQAKPLTAEINLTDLVEPTAGFTGAQLECLANEAALLAVRRARLAGQPDTRIAMQDFLDAMPSQTRSKGLNSVDAVMVESVAHLARPRGQAEVQIGMRDGVKFRGEIIWADGAFIKVRTAGDETEILIPKTYVQSVQSLSCEPPEPQDLQTPSWSLPMPSFV